MNPLLLKPPQVRPRSPTGMVPLDWQRAPTDDDAWPDKVHIDLTGEVWWPDGVSFIGYLRDIARETTIRKKPTVGRKFRTPIDYGSVQGDVTIAMISDAMADEPVAGRARIKLSLFLNPTRTRAQAIRRNNAALESLSLRDFFRRLPPVREAFSEHGVVSPDGDALDENDNFFWNADEAGGTTPDARARSRDEFLPLYERRLIDLVHYLLSPFPDAPVERDTLGAGRGHVCLNLDWGGLNVRHAEIYVERFTTDAPAIVHRLHDRGLSLARSIRASKFTTPACVISEAEHGLAHLVVPLTGSRNIDLSIYAKTAKRVRFEVRYRHEFSGVIRHRAAKDETRLASALSCLLRDAIKRMPWSELRRACQIGPEANPSDIVELVTAIQSACQDHPSLFPHLADRILLTGGVSNHEKDHPGIGTVIKRLTRAGILERWQVQQKEARTGRRYALAPSHHSTRLKMLRGFMPEDRSVEDQFANPAPSEWSNPSERWSGPHTTAIRLAARKMPCRLGGG